jgi:hypothetical protein
MPETTDQPPSDSESRPPPSQSKQVDEASTMNKVQLAISGAQGLGIWVVAFLLLVQLFTQFGTNSRLTELEGELNGIGYSLDTLESRVGTIGKADVLNLNAVMMQGSSTYTLPVSAIDWNGR